MSKKKKHIVPADSASLENTSSEKKDKKKHKPKFVQKILSKCYEVMLKPVSVFVRKQIADLLDIFVSGNNFVAVFI